VIRQIESLVQGFHDEEFSAAPATAVAENS